MAANKQCPYRIQNPHEHICKNNSYVPSLNECILCLEGQKADAIELVASAIMEKSIDKMEDEIK